MLSWRMLWKDWGFAASLFNQAKNFLASAKQIAGGSAQQGLVRASIVFSLMSFEAYFFEIVKGYMQEKGATLDPMVLRKVQDGFAKHAGIHEAVRDWPKFLTGKSLDATTNAYANFANLTKYRNALLHGKITEKIPSWGKLAQDVETIEAAEFAQRTAAEMVKVVASHFGFAIPTWL